MRKYWPLFIGVVSLAPAQNIIQLPDSIRAATDTVVWVKKIPAYCEGPVWEAATGYVYFDRQIGNNAPNWPIWRVKPGVDTGIIFVSTEQNNGLDFDPQGRLIACQKGRISRYFSNGTLDSTLVISPASGATLFNQANDLSIGSNGAIYFTDLNTKVFYLSPTRVLSVAATGLSQANGIEWLQEENNVYVNETSGNRVRRFPIRPNDSLGPAASFITSPNPDGGTVDSHGNRYIASYSQGEVRVFNARGDSIGRIALRVASGIYDSVSSAGRVGIQGNVDNCVFGGPDLKTLYITGDGGLYSIQLKIPGRVRYPTPIVRYQLRPKKQNGPDLFRDLRGRWLGNQSGKMPEAIFRLPPVKN
jgi:gluconolactonase